MYELMAQFWPTADEDPDSTGPMVEFSGICACAGAALKDKSPGDLSLGGAHLAGQFFAQGLLDELRLYIHPVVLGEGTRLFPTQVQRGDLSLLETTVRQRRGAAALRARERRLTKQPS